MTWLEHAVCLWVILNLLILAALVATAEIESKSRHPGHFG
jgi:hypothetical protein